MSSVMSRVEDSATQYRPSWHRRAVLVLTGVALAALYAPMSIEMMHKWLSDEYSAHGLFIPFMVGLLLWWKRSEIADTPRSCCAWGLALLGTGLLIQIIAWHERMPTFVAMSLVPTLLGLTLTLAGPRLLRLLWFPIVFLVFATPLPRWVVQPLSLPIQTASARAAFGIVRFLGFPMIEQGFSVALPNVTVEVAESCSGFKKSISLMVFAAYYASLYAIPWWRQGLLVLLAAPFALFANIVRVVGLILAGAWGGSRGVHLFHDVSELIVLGLCFALLLGAGRLLGCRKIRYFD